FAGEDWKPDAAWMTLDPTEGQQEANLVERGTGLWASARQLVDYANVLWINYVAGLNARRQRQGIYEPMVQTVIPAVDNIFTGRVWHERLRAVADSPLGTFWDWYRRHWFSWRGGLVAAGFSLTVALGYYGLRWLRACLRRLLGHDEARDEPPVLEMYRRL